MKRRLILLATYALLSSAAALAGVEDARASAQAPDAVARGVIARVGDQAITFQDINTALNSSAIVGMSVPALGTPQRDRVRVMLLDRFISANLFYLDARDRGLDKDPVYTREVERFDDGVLAGLYLSHLRDAVAETSDAEVRAYFAKRVPHGTELTSDLRDAIRSKLRRDKIQEQRQETLKHLRDGVEILVHAEHLSPDGDAARSDQVVLAEIAGRPLTWGAIADRILAAGEAAVREDPLASAEEGRERALEREIDLRVMAMKAKAAGLDQDPLFKARSAEFRKTRLINLHRDRVLAAMEPSERALKRFFEANRARILVPEARKVQMVVVKTEEEAKVLKAAIEAGSLTMYQAAQQHSIAPRAKEDLGEIGWVSRGEALPALDAAIFALGPNQVSTPVQTPAGWHLLMVQDMQEAKHTDFADPGTRKLARREYLNDTLNAYTVDLRKSHFNVQVYEDALARIAQQEADMVKELAEKAAQPGSVTEQRAKALGKRLRP